MSKKMRAYEEGEKQNIKQGLDRMFDLIRQMTNAELADKLLVKVWSALPMGSEAGLLIEAAVDRLKV